jgi:glycerol-3-phosphate acyltransferase PlsY
MTLTYFLFPILGYLFGSLPFSVWITRYVKHVDLRDSGSGHATTTNTIRQAGFGWGALVLILDISKGFIPTYLAVNQDGIPAHRSVDSHLRSLALLADICAIPAAWGWQLRAGLPCSQPLVFSSAWVLILLCWCPPLCARDCARGILIAPVLWLLKSAMFHLAGWAQVS